MITAHHSKENEPGMTNQQPAQPQLQPPQPAPTKKRHGPVFWVLVGGGILVAFLVWISACGAILGAVGSEDTTATSAPSSPPATVADSAPPAEETTIEPEPEPSNCKPLKKSQLSEIAPGMDRSARVKSGVLVPLTDEYQFGFNQVIALALTNGSVATFATENLGKSDHGLLMAVNGTARKHFTWGAAVRPGSPMDDDLQAVKDSAEYTEAVDCVEGS
jgi:hypothetical protein